MNLPEHFETFFGRISVDDARLNRVRKAHMAMSRALRQDGYVDRAMFETFLQGSCAHGTLVRPLGKGTEFDIDVCCLLDLGQVPTRSKEPKPVVRWLAKRIRRIEAYRGKVKSRPRCVRVEFPGDFHIDVVPLAEDSRIGSQLYVPNVDRNSWEPTNPKGLADWYGQQNQRTNVRFVRVADAETLAESGLPEAASALVRRAGSADCKSLADWSKLGRCSSSRSLQESETGASVFIRCSFCDEPLATGGKPSQGLGSGRLRAV